MKILMLNYEFPPMGGGAGNATDNISKEMTKIGHDVTVLTSGYRGLPKYELKDGVKIYRVFSWRRGIHDCGFRGAYTYLLSAAIKLLSLRKNNQFDIVHYFFSLPTGLLSLLPWVFRKTLCIFGYLNFIFPVVIGISKGILTCILNSITGLGMAGIISIFHRIFSILWELVFVLLMLIHSQNDTERTLLLPWRSYRTNSSRSLYLVPHDG